MLPIAPFLLAVLVLASCTRSATPPVSATFVAKLEGKRTRQEVLGVMNGARLAGYSGKVQLDEGADGGVEDVGFYFTAADRNCEGLRSLFAPLLAADLGVANGLDIDAGEHRCQEWSMGSKFVEFCCYQPGEQGHLGASIASVVYEPVRLDHGHRPVSIP
jgi:hypothetical protein